MNKVCGYCRDLLTMDEDWVHYEDSAYHPECFKDKARDEMPSDAAEKVVEHVENGIRHFRIEGEGLLPIETGGERP